MDRLHDLITELVGVAVSFGQPPGAGSVSLSQALALQHLSADRVLAQGELAVRLHLEKSTVSRLIAGMASEGLVERRRDPANRRFLLLRLTDQGRAVQARMATAFHDRQARLATQLTATEREALLVGLPALLRVLQGTRTDLSRRV